MAGEGPDRESVPSDVLKAAERAHVLDILGQDKELRAAMGEHASVFLYQAVFGARRLDELSRIAEAFERQGIAVVPFKGMAYALLFEEGGPSRAMADTDLLVPQARYEEACARMQDLGYEALDMQTTGLHAHERAFVKDRLMVEIHQRFLPGDRVAFDYEGIWSRLRPAGPECPHCRLLGPEDTFVYHAFHMGMHEFVHGLRPVWELRRLLRLDQPELAVCAARARAWGVLSMCWCALRLMQLCFPGSIRREDLARFAPHPARCRVLEHLIVRPSLGLLVEPGLLPRHVQLFRKALLVDRPLGAASYLLDWVRASLP